MSGSLVLGLQFAGSRSISRARGHSMQTFRTIARNERVRERDTRT